MRIVLVLVLATACSGTAGVRDHSEAHVVAEHCRDHACASTPQARSLGDGCYVVEDALYQCTNDELPSGQVSCLDVTPCAGECTRTFTDGRGREISTKQCRDRWQADREARRPPPTCAPAQLEVAIGSAAAGAPSALPLPATLVTEVLRSGKVRVWYQVEACATGNGVTVGEVAHATGFAELDRVLRDQVSALTLPQGECVSVSLVASHFECETEQTAD